MKKIEHLPINWVNGLKLTNRHFYESYYNMIETARQTREEFLTDYNYGFGDEIEKEFTVSDIWHNDYTRENVIQIFSKPDPEFKAKHEYDKYFSQPIKLFSYSGLLDNTKKGNVIL